MKRHLYPQDALSLIKKDAVDAVNIKLMKCGGIYPALQINSICEAANIPCMVGCMAGETNISIAAAAHFVAAQKCSFRLTSTRRLI